MKTHAPSVLIPRRRCAARLAVLLSSLLFCIGVGTDTASAVTLPFSENFSSWTPGNIPANFPAETVSANRVLISENSTTAKRLLITYHNSDDVPKSVTKRGHSVLQCEETGIYVSVFPEGLLPGGSIHHRQDDDVMHGYVESKNWRTVSQTYYTTKGVEVTVLCSDCLTAKKIKAPDKKCDWHFWNNCSDYTLNSIIQGVDQEKPDCGCGYYADDILDAETINYPIDTETKLKLLEENNCKRWKCERTLWGVIRGYPKNIK